MSQLPFKILKALIVDALGWSLIIIGLALMVLPGPGILTILAGLFVLSSRYTWAERRLAPAKKAARIAIRASVETWRSFIIAITGIIVTSVLAIYWIVEPAQPQWWPLPDYTWLPGGRMTGLVMLISIAISIAALIYAINHHGRPGLTKKD